jgi:hypothetical protein
VEIGAQTYNAVPEKAGAVKSMNAAAGSPPRIRAVFVYDCGKAIACHLIAGDEQGCAAGGNINIVGKKEVSVKRAGVSGAGVENADSAFAAVEYVDFAAVCCKGGNGSVAPGEKAAAAGIDCAGVFFDTVKRKRIAEGYPGMYNMYAVHLPENGVKTRTVDIKREWDRAPH